MKKIIRTITAVAILFATTTMANELKLDTDGTSKSLSFEWDAQFVDTSIKIEDQNGDIIYADNFTEVDKYAKRFDLSPLPQGDYFLKVENTMREVVYSIRVNQNDVSIVDEKENLKPVYRKEDGKVYLSLLNLDKENVKVSVVDSSRRVLFTESFEEESIVEKTFNFQDALEGDYTLVVEDGESTYYESVSVK